jgi:hypothetical protein
MDLIGILPLPGAPIADAMADAGEMQMPLQLMAARQKD